jgi:hypothetical protein
MGKQPSGALSRLLLKPADILESIDDLPDNILVSKDKMTTRGMLMNSSINNEE